MTIQVNIGEAKTRLSELVAASISGETVKIARAGKAVVTLVPAPDVVEAAREERGAKRRAAFGMLRDDFAGYDTSIEALKADRVSLNDRARRIYS